MTEEEAREKWCPMARVHGMESAGNRIDHANCIASGCMAWVWDDTEELIGSMTIKHLNASKTSGHCGLVK